MLGKPVSFYLAIKRQDSSVQKVRCVLFDNAIDLNASIQRRGLWRSGSLVRALTIGTARPDNAPLITIMLSRQSLCPGVVAHEISHALFYICRHSGYKPGAKLTNRNTVTRSGHRCVAGDEEWMCTALERAVIEFYTKVKQRGMI